MSDHPDHAGRVADTFHLDLGDGKWADLRTSLNHGQAQQIEAAQQVADYDTKGAFTFTVARVESALSGAPDEWRTIHYDPTVSVVTRALEAYEATMEGALLSPERRRLMADAVNARNETYGRVFTAAWSVTDTAGNVVTDLSDWSTVDGGMVRRIQRQALTLWVEWNRGITASLKGGAASSKKAA